MQENGAVRGKRVGARESLLTASAKDSLLTVTDIAEAIRHFHNNFIYEGSAVETVRDNFFIGTDGKSGFSGGKHHTRKDPLPQPATGIY
jgi:hypothetical protein